MDFISKGSPRKSRSDQDEVTFQDILQAQQRIARYCLKTPLFDLSPFLPSRVTLKLEQHQLTGCFKLRGVMNCILAHESSRIKGLVTASGGNHGRALAYAAQRLGYGARVVVSKTTPEHKIKDIQGYGANVILYGNSIDEAIVHAQGLAQDSGELFVHPFADPLVIAGQGTLALEILDERKDLETLVIAIGGGGMMSGIAIAAKTLNPNIRLIGIEPAGCPTLHDSLQANRIVEVETVATKAGTLAIKKTSLLNFEIIKKYVDEIHLVSDDQMLATSRKLWSELAISAEMSGSAALAGILFGNFISPQEKVGTIICGSGVDGIPGLSPYF